MSSLMSHTITQIHQIQKRLSGLSDAELLEQSLSLKYEVRAGTRLSKIIPRAFALVREAARRTLNMQHFDVQLVGGIHLVKGRVTEIATGEGKTLVATLPVYIHALKGKGAHVATVNDYLANRDAETMGPVYRALGLTVGVIQTDHKPEHRRAAYSSDVTYGTSKEFGFDFLRDRLAAPQGELANLVSGGRHPSCVMRPLYFALVDEADSVLIDEARTPMIISVQAQNNDLIAECFKWATEHAASFVENRDYEYDHKERRVKLLSPGRILLRRLPQNAGTRSANMHQLEKYLQSAIKVKRDFHLDKHYAIDDEGKIVIIDEFTGRPAEGRKWQDGIHQAVEVKEGVEMTPENRAGASVTVQDYFLQYQLLAGMTGTAWTSRREFKRIYKKTVVRVATHKKCIRRSRPVRCFKNWDQKWLAIVEEVEQLLAAGRSVLIGTRSVERSERLSALLTEKNIDHTVLNARHLTREAEIIAQAGQPGRVTVATNMAGRGTDIILDDEVKAAGGLHVILSEIHEAARIDRQFIGRCARQGDPGTYRIFVSMEDEILGLGLGPKQAKRFQQAFKAGRTDDVSTFHIFRKAQRQIQYRYFVDRLILHKQYKEQRERLMEMGHDPYLDVPK